MSFIYFFSHERKIEMMGMGRLLVGMGMVREGKKEKKREKRRRRRRRRRNGEEKNKGGKIWRRGGGGDGTAVDE